MSDRNVEAVYPLSPMQEGILFHSLYAEDSRVYFEQIELTYEGVLDAALLRRAWQRMVDRHSILRTLFVWERQKKPLQVVRRHAEVAWSEADWREMAADEREHALEGFRATDRDRGFDLAKAPPVRLSLIRTGERTWQLVWSFHHILLDGWSMAVLGREVHACYEAFVRGVEPVLPPVRPYREYILWLQQRSPAKDEAFWRRFLDGFTTPGRLKPMATASGGRGFREERAELPEGQAAALEALARQQRLTPSTLFQALWALVVGRHTGESEVVFGAAFSGRPPELAGVESMVGLFIGTLPVRVQLTGEAMFLSWVKGLQDAQFELLQHQHASLVDIQSWSQVPRGVSLFESLLVYENYPIDPASAEWTEGVAVTGFRYWAHTNFPLHFRVMPSNRWHLSLTYDADRFDEATARALLDQVQALLTQVLARPESRLDDLSLLTSGSRGALPDAAAGLAAEALPPVTGDFEAWAQRAPAGTALSQGSRTLGYGELRDRAHGVAQALVGAGLAAGDVVAIEGRPCFGLIAGLLGTLLARGVALIVDEQLPAERRRLMCREAGARYLVRLDGESRDAGEPALEGWRSIVTVDASTAAAAGIDAEKPIPVMGPQEDDAAYVFFTSGTTGVPKGVLGTHLGLSHFVRWQRSRFEVRPGDRCSQLTGLSFDVVLREIFLPLTSGATLCLPDEAGELGAERVMPWLQRESITILHTVPTLARAWVADAPADVRLRALRLVFFAGEPLEGVLVRRWRERFETAALVVNLYGPTETTLAKCFYEVPADPGDEVQPVGRPLPQSQALVVAAGGRMCGVGEWGEIAVRTPYRTRGYVNASRESRQRFRPNPARPGEPGDLVYYTGDRGRFRADGVLEISGRLDDQVKIRGARVEPDEVAAVLRQHAAVRQAAVLARDVGRERRLVAYVVTAPDSPPEAADLKRFLKARLPEYMIPSAFVVLDSLPVTANGKLDRRALPLPAEIAGEPAAAAVSPRTPIEAELAAIWREVLQLSTVGVQDDFFERGGHSLLATQVVSRVRSAFGVELPIRRLLESPTIAGLASAVEAALLGRDGTPPAAAVAPVSRDQPLPLSFAQQRLWFLDQMTPGTPAYNMPLALRLRGDLDVPVLERALAEILRRHEVLRSTVDVTAGVAAQKVHAAAPVPLPTVDLRGWAPDAREEEALRLAEEEAARPFDLVRGPLFRASLVRLDAREHLLLVTQHHIASDAWSQSVFLRELGALYGAFVAGRPSPLPDLAVQYGDFSHWQRQWLEGDRLETQLAYWKDRLAGPLPVLQLPTDRPRPPIQSFRGARHSVVLPRPLRDELVAFGRREGATLFMTLLAGFGALLHRYTGQTDVLVGTPIAGRSRTETESLIGLFVNTLVMRLDLSGPPSFRVLLGRARETALGAYTHPDLPFEKLVDAVQPERDLGRNPVFQTVIALQNAAPPVTALGGLDVSAVSASRRDARFDLVLFLVESPDGLTAVFEYATDLFDSATIERMAGHWQRLLEEAVSSPGRPVTELSMLGPADDEQLRDMSLGPRRAYPRDSTVHAEFEGQAERTPDAVALTFAGGASVSYADLNRRSNRLARRLRALGVGLEVPVGICVERSIEMIVGILAILKAGGAYVPLDPTYPRERLAFLIEDSAVPVLLTQERFLAELPAGRARVLVLDVAEDEAAVESGENLGVGGDAENLAYVTYTSGSTGRPKGVEVRHRGVLRLVLAANYVELGAGHTLLQLAPVTFDASTLEIWGALLLGGRCVLSAERAPSAKDLGALIDREQVSTMWLTSSLYNLVVDEAPEALRGLKQLLIGGEALSVPHVRRGLAALPGTRIVNGYGPTEGTTFTCCHPIPAALDEPSSSIPIGRPIAHTRVHVLGEGMSPVPVGVAGELFIAGDGLARGYLRRPELTAEKFVPDPFGDERGGRLYRTGDLVRWRADGSIEFLGRTDQQVKVRGFRVEPGEIESVLKSHADVRDAVVVVRESRPGDKRLVAYVAPREARNLDAGALRTHVAARLPEYMVPSAFVPLESLPLTPNGKVDHARLPAPEDFAAAGGYEPPRTAAEAALSRIWAEVLGVPEVGIRDDFFELGGDSILSLQVVARASAAGLRLSLKQLFQAPTVAELAAVAGRAAEREIPQGPVTGDVPLTPVQRWFFERDLEERHHFNQAVLLELRREVDSDLLARALAALESHHDGLRGRFTMGPAGWQQRVGAPGAGPGLRRVDLSALGDSEQRAAMEAISDETQRSLDLERGPLWRAVRFALGPGRGARLLLVAHHLVIDGVSWRVLLEDLHQACEQLSRGKDVAPAAKTTSFQRWAERLVEHVGAGGVDDELAYWREVVATETARLVPDHPRSEDANRIGDAQSVSVVLDEPDARALLQEVPAAYRTQLGDALLAALVESLAAWTGGDEWRIDVEGHGREDLFPGIDVSRTVGWFTTIYPVRLRRASSIRDTLRGVKEELRRVPNHGIGYGLLRYLGGQELPARADVSFNYLGQFDQIVGPGSLFGTAPESPGRTRSERGRRAHLVDVNAYVLGGRLRLDFGYSAALFERATMEAFASAFGDALRAMVEQCRRGDWGFTPSDFPLAGLDQETLDRVADRDVEDVYPLSPMQAGMLFHGLVSPDLALYCEQGRYDLEGPLDADAFRRAWQRVVDRHAVLRSRFCWEGLDRPLQVVERTAGLSFEEEDWRDIAFDLLESKLEGLGREERRRGVALDRAPLMRLRLVRLGDERHRLWWTFHHALIDGWCVPLLWKEVLGLYRSFTGESGRAELTDPRPYRDYIAWLSTQDPRAAERYWRGALAGFTAPTPLLLDRPRGAAPAMDVVHHAFALDERTTASLKRLGRRHGVTLNTILQGAWALLLAHYSGERDVLFGVTVSGRPPSLPGVETMVGLFINTQPLRVEVPGDRPLLDWLKDLQARQVEQRQYEYASLADVQAWSEVENGRPLFESLLVFENYPVDPSLRDFTHGLRVKGLGITESTNYPLILMAADASALALRLIFDRARFDPEAVALLGRRLERVLAGIATNADGCLDDVPLTDEAEHRRLIQEWTATATPYPRDKTIGELFGAQAARTPDAVAVSFGDRRLSYRELDERSNRLARHLLALGAGLGARVAVLLDRSLELPAALLAILKAGGAYVPLDPSYPAERLSFMLADSGASVLVTEERTRGRVPAAAARAVCVDTDAAKIAARSAETVGGGAGPDDLAYVTYTSGSTGVPKGVEVLHRGVTRLVFGSGFADFGAEETFLQLAPVSFDASTLELWGPLLHGGKCVLFPERLPSAEDLGEVIRREGVTTLWLTASLYNAVIAEQPSALRGLKQLLIGGEALSVDHVRRGLAELPGTRIINGYGPTESTTFTCCYSIPRELPGDATSIPIGRPIGNTRVYVLDRAQRPVPIGLAGELYIGGDGLARGYLARPGLTAEAFVPDPFSGESGARLYRTGDLVRYGEDGNVEFLGRLDHQVKVHGFRVEPGEVEAVLRQHPAVKDAAVVVREDDSGQKRLVAYVTWPDGRTADAAHLIAHVEARLPRHMVPSAVVALPSLPLNANGKLDRLALPAPTRQARADAALVPPRDDLEASIAAIWREVLRRDDVGVHDNFFDLGGHSLTLLQVHGRLRKGRRDLPLKIVDLFRHPTIASLAAYLSPSAAGGAEPASAPLRGQGREAGRHAPEDAVAIIGMAGRFPGARDVGEFWRNLRDGIEAISFFSVDELVAAGIPAVACRAPGYVRARGVLEGAELFDAAFFGYNAREAESMDPQHRVFLEAAWSALESAGYDSERCHGRVGVYAGTSLNSYLFQLGAEPELLASGGTPLLLASDKDFLTTRVSYKLDLRGPSVDVQTACSTSLVAVHLACRSLLGHECDMALAGGVSILVPQRSGHQYQEEGIRSPDGHCRAFDAKAQGTVGGSGVGVVVLKRLRDALADGDTIEAVIKGSAVNNDGALKVGYTAPGVEGQAEVIAMAQAAAGVEPETVGYVEAHGTGTALGDPIEIQALRQAFEKGGRRRAPCAIGSVKTNVGHLDAAAGVAGLIKAVLALKHRQIPPSLHFESPNPALDLAETPFRVNARLLDWPDDGGPRRAGVSSFGIGGTNAHVVLEEAPPAPPASLSRRPAELLVLSAKTPAALDRAARDLSIHLRGAAAASLVDTIYTLQEGRRAFRHRRFAVVRDVADASRVLEGLEPGRLVSGQGDRSGSRVAFLFPGQGAQHPHMCRGLYDSEDAFRAEVDRGAAALRSELGFDLRDAIFPAGDEAGAPSLDQTAVSQPALFVVEYALARLWMGWGIRPEALLGHSVGEYAAACLAGVFSLEDALSLVAARGRLMQALPAGSMLAVALSEQETRPLLNGALSLAATNGPSQCVVSGPGEATDALASLLAARGVECQRLRTSHAFHSSMMDPALASFRERVASVERHAPRIPFVSNVTGTWITDAEAQDPGYWARHLRETVRFDAGLGELLKDDRVLLEVGPGQNLVGLVRARADFGRGHAAVASARHVRDSRPDENVLLGALGHLWISGVEVDWRAHHAGQRRRRVTLPTYSYDRQRYWRDARKSPAETPLPSPAPRGRADISDWFYRPSWRSSDAPLQEPRDLGDDAGWLLFLDEAGLGERVAERLRQRGRRVVTLTPAVSFQRYGADAYGLRPGEAADYDALVRDLRGRGEMPRRAAHLWGVTSRSGSAPSLEQHQDLGFFSLIFLAQALGSGAPDADMSLTVVTNGMQQVGGEDLVYPEKATVLGPCRVIPLEYPRLRCRSVDLRSPGGGDWPEEDVDRVLAECLDASGAPVVAYRGCDRWEQTFDPVRLAGGDAGRSRLREEGVYLITGGLGGIGLEIARYLFDAVRARLVLVGRRGLPSAEGRDAESDAAGDEGWARLRKVRALEQEGAEVLVLAADVSDHGEMEEALRRAEARFGTVHGVIHAAGVAPGGIIQLKTRALAEHVLRPKVQGTLVLEAVLRSRRPDFLLLCSSLASVLGIPGQADYCAANAFQDAFARRAAAAGGPFVVSVNWDTWREAGMASKGTLGEGILSVEGREAFARALRHPLPQVLVSTTDLAGRLRDSVAAPTATGDQEGAARTAFGHPRPDLPTPYGPPRDEVERAVAQVWQELLGFEQVGIHDNFFDLGGHSLLAMQVVNRLRETFQVALRLQDLFEAPSVAELARALARNEGQPGRVREVARLARRLELLSDEELARLLEDEGTPDGRAR